jgi:hypothetical protein
MAMLEELERVDAIRLTAVHTPSQDAVELLRELADPADPSGNHLAFLSIELPAPSIELPAHKATRLPLRADHR